MLSVSSRQFKSSVKKLFYNEGFVFDGIMVWPELSYRECLLRRNSNRKKTRIFLKAAKKILFSATPPAFLIWQRDGNKTFAVPLECS